MGKSQYVSLQDAAQLSGKSPQTNRRLIKGNNVRYRKYKTPQGFTYLVEKNSLLDRFEEEGEVEVAPVKSSVHGAINGTGPRKAAMEMNRIEMDPIDTEESELVEEFDPASVMEVEQGAPQSVARPQERPFMGGSMASGALGGMESSVVSQLIQQHREDKKRLFELLEIFQKRILTLEDQVKQLEAPKAKPRWWALWRRG